MFPLQQEWKNTLTSLRERWVCQLTQHRSHATLVKAILKQQSKSQWLLLAPASAFSGSFRVTYQSWFANLLLAFVRKGVTLGLRQGARKHEAKERTKGAWDWRKKPFKMWRRTIFFPSGCHLPTEMFIGVLQGELQSLMKLLRTLLQGWLPENIGPASLVKQNPTCLPLGNSGSQTTLQRGEFAKQCYCL